MLASRPSKWTFLCKSFWDSGCGNGILVGCGVISTLFALGMLLILWIYFNFWMGVETKHIVLVMMSEIAIIALIGLCCANIWEFHKELQTSNHYWNSFLKSNLCELCGWIFGLIGFVIVIYMIYNFNYWIISHHYVDLPNNRTSTTSFAGDMIFLEFIFGIFGIFGLIVVVGCCFCLYQNCHETSLKMAQDLQQFRENEELLRAKDMV
jgi:hypothetical protein